MFQMAYVPESKTHILKISQVPNTLQGDSTQIYTVSFPQQFFKVELHRVMLKGIFMLNTFKYCLSQYPNRYFCNLFF